MGPRKPLSQQVGAMTRHAAPQRFEEPESAAVKKGEVRPWTRLTALELKVDRYRNAVVVLAATLAGVLLLGATTGDVHDVIRTKKLMVVDEAGEIVVGARTDDGGNGAITVMYRTGRS